MSMRTATLLKRYRDGDEIGWDEQFAWLDENHADQLAELEEDIAAHGIRIPILLGNDGRVWDGHHRLRVAVRRDIKTVPTRVVDHAGDGVIAVPKGSEDGAITLAPSYVRPDPDEVQKIVDILEENDFETYKDMARELHKMCFEMLRDREWWTVYRGGCSFEGLEQSETAIRNWSAKRYHPNTPLRFARISGPSLIAAAEKAAAEEIESDETRVSFWRGGKCPECDHLGEMHVTFLTGWVKSEEKNQPGKCTAPLSAGPRRAGSGSKGAKTCGCDYALRQGFRR